MPIDITGTDTWSDPVQAPTSGDPKTSYGFLRTAIQHLANRTAWLKNRLGVARTSGKPGIATLDSDARPEQVPRNGEVIERFVLGLAEVHTTSALALTNNATAIAGSRLTFADDEVMVGDVLEVAADLLLDPDTAGGGDEVEVEVFGSFDNGATWTAVADTLRKWSYVGNNVATDGDKMTHIRTRLTVGAVTDATLIELRHHNIGGVRNVGTTIKSFIVSAKRP